MTRYKDDIIKEIQSRLDIVDIISESVSLTRKGNRYWGICPFHQEKTPSFCVTPEKNMFYCFGCHTGGDIFSFLMKRDNISFSEAVEILAAKAGIERTNKLSSKEIDKIKKITAINNAVAKYYHQQLLNQENDGYKYLTGRKVNLETIKNFQLGYADELWNNLEIYLGKRGFEIKDLSLAGLVKKSEKTNKYFDIFRNRVIFPIFSYSGQVVGFGGRAIDDSIPKYLNSPETDVFSKRKHLYGLYQSKDAIKRENQVILVEGYIDCIKLNQHGIRNVVASLGTAFTEDQAKLIKRYAEKVIVLFDGDEAGQRETLKVIEIFENEDIKIEVVTLTGSKDPDEYLDLYGKEDFLQFLKNNKISTIEFKLNRHLNDIDILSLEDKIKILNNLRSDINRITSEIQKDYFIKLIAQKLMIEENLIYREFKLNYNLPRLQSIKRNKKQIIIDNINYGNYSIEEKFLAEMLKNNDLVKKIDNLDGWEFFSVPHAKNLAYLIKLYKDYNSTQFNNAIRDYNLETYFARIMLCSEESGLTEYEINDFLKKIANNKWQKKWKDLYQQLNDVSNHGDFYSMLKFILNLNTVFNNTQEGGIK